MKEIKIGIVGSRRRDSKEDLKCLVDFILPIFEYYDREGYTITLVSGGCKKGGDRFAEILRDQFNLSMIIHYPKKENLPDDPQTRDFAKINFARNTLIAIDSDVLVAMCAPDRLGGTEDTVKKFKKYHPKNILYII
jgi:hypothetical protein